MKTIIKLQDQALLDVSGGVVYLDPRLLGEVKDVVKEFGPRVRGMFSWGGSFDYASRRYYGGSCSGGGYTAQAAARN